MPEIDRKITLGQSRKMHLLQLKRKSRQKTAKNRHSCKNCKRSFSVLVDTIFEDTRLPSPKWFAIITLMLNSKSGISAMELQRNIGGSYKTSYTILIL